MTVEVVARPGSPRRGVLRKQTRGLVIGLAAPAEKGKANEELIALVAELAGVARRDIRILRGASARIKTLRIADADPQKIAARILRAASAKQK